MVEFIGIREHSRIVAATPADLEELDKVRAGRPLHVAVSYDRSSRHNRWFHKLLAVVADGIGEHPAVLKLELKYSAGLVNAVFMSKLFGRHIDFKSTAFDKMDESEFTAFRVLAVEIIFRDILPGVRRQDVYRQVEDLTGEACPW